MRPDGEAVVRRRDGGVNEARWRSEGSKIKIRRWHDGSEKGAGTVIELNVHPRQAER